MKAIVREYAKLGQQHVRFNTQLSSRVWKMLTSHAEPPYLGSI